MQKISSLAERIKKRETVISVIGLGYVGLPLAIAFGEKAHVVGFDLNAEKIARYQQGQDPTGEVGAEVIKKTTVCFTSESALLKTAEFHIVAVPTPITTEKTPDLTPLISASKILGANLVKGSVVVYESTVYPGVTEEICIPVLEAASGLTCGKDFKVGYSPERINPGDKNNRLSTIVKVVAGMDEEAREVIALIYEMIIAAGVKRVSSIQVAEATKVVENSQRDVNIAFMNEMAMVFHKMGIDTNEVLEAMDTKWNALHFRPGLVGGHCIGVDPYYFIYKADKIGHHSQIVYHGRRINDSVSRFIADELIKKLVREKMHLSDAKVYILGLTFKENCPDLRNSKVADVITRLWEYSIDPLVADPVADKQEAELKSGCSIVELTEIRDADVLVFAVAHNEFKALSRETVMKMYKPERQTKILFDVKGIFNKQEMINYGFDVWQL